MPAMDRTDAVAALLEIESIKQLKARSGPNRQGAERCSSTPITRTPASRSGPAAATRSAVARIAIELTVCHDTPNSAAIAAMVMRSIINHRNT